MSICSDCDGKGFKEYDAGLLQIGCRTCSGIGKVDCELTKDEFERAYAFRSDMTTAQVLALGLVAMPSDCVEGWVMEKSPIPEGTDSNAVHDGLLFQFNGGNPGEYIDDEEWLMVRKAIADARVYPHIIEMPCGEVERINNPESILNLRVKDIPCPCGNPKHYLVRYIVNREVVNDNQGDSGNQPANQPTGSRNTGKSSKPKKSKAEAKARK